MLITQLPVLQVHWSFPKSPGPDEVSGLVILSEVFPLFHISEISFKVFRINLQTHSVVNPEYYYYNHP